MPLLPRPDLPERRLMSTILITDGEQRAALAATRSLGRAGHTVVVCSSRRASIAGGSRFCAQEELVPSALADVDGFVERIRQIVARHGVDTVIPISEPSLLAILPARGQLEGVRVPFPTYESFLRICDKAEVARAAQTVGIRVPEQQLITAPTDADRVAATARFPLVLKPGRSVVGEGAKRRKVSVIHVASAAAFRSALERLPEEAYPVLAQERIVGPGIGVFVLLREGAVQAAFAHRRLREKPPSGGVSVLRESVPLDPDLLDRCVRLLRAFDWEGVAMVECKVSEATGIPYIMEINGRFWGSLQLAIDAGVDFPRLLVDGIDGLPPVTEYTVGVRSWWEWGDVDHLIARFRRSREELSLPEDAPSRLGALMDFVKAFGPRNRSEVLRLGDPQPFLRESASWVRGR